MFGQLFLQENRPGTTGGGGGGGGEGKKIDRKIVYFTFGTFYAWSRRSADSAQVGVFHLGQT